MFARAGCGFQPAWKAGGKERMGAKAHGFRRCEGCGLEACGPWLGASGGRVIPATAGTHDRQRALIDDASHMQLCEKLSQPTPLCAECS